MHTIICLGKSAEVYGPFDNPLSAEAWLITHCKGFTSLCNNGISYMEHQTVRVWPVRCRICGHAIFHDPDNRPSNIDCCFSCDDRLEEARHGLA